MARRSAMCKATGLSNLVTVPVSHCYGAQAVSLTFPNGFKFSYSGDCRPSKEFAKIGKGSTVLLHEATFDDELSGDAEAKKHSTTSEAIGVGMAMEARRVILTHFSQRYQKIPSTGSMKSLNVKFEDAKETEESMAAIEPPENVENAEDGEPMAVESSSTQPPNGNTAHTLHSKPSSENLPRKPTHDMKIGVAFDYMRVKVGDIIHLEKFTPALRELYKDVEREEQDAKAKKAAREAFSDTPPTAAAPVQSGHSGQSENGNEGLADAGTCSGSPRGWDVETRWIGEELKRAKMARCYNNMKHVFQMLLISSSQCT